MEPIVEKGRVISIIEQATFPNLDVRLGEYGYVQQNDGLVVIEPENALALSDALVAWVGAMPTSHPTDLKADNAALVSERDEADRRAGAAERRVAHLEKSEARRSQWLHKAKVQAGYSHAVSFDVVWAEALAALQAQRALQATEPRP